MSEDRHGRGDERDSIWVSSDVAADEHSYVLTVHFSDDLSHPLTDGGGIAYAATLLRACAAAEYDAAVFTQLTTKLGLDASDAAQILAGLRKARARETWTAGPLEITPGVSVFDRTPFVRCSAGGRSWQWDPADCKQHALHVLEGASAVEDDAIYRGILTETIGIDPQRALAVVEDIAHFR
jgi:hypothetical protein